MTEDISVLTRHSRAPDATIAYGDDRDNVADVRYGSGCPEHRPLIVMIHGGFWRPTYDRVHTGPMSAALAESGWTVASIEYRRNSGHPDETLQDVERAIECLPSLLRCHSGKVVLMGHSAGGHLALWAGAKRVTRELVGIVALAPVADLRLAETLNLGDGAIPLFLGVSAESRPDIDPTVLQHPAAAVTIIHGVADDTVPLSVSQSYVAAHPRTRLVPLPGTAHFAVIDPLTAAWGRVMDELRRMPD